MKSVQTSPMFSNSQRDSLNSHMKGRVCHRERLSGRRVFTSMSSCICGLDKMSCRMLLGSPMICCTNGLSMSCLSMSGFLSSSRCMFCCSSMKLLEPKPRPSRPGRPPMDPRPNGVAATSITHHSIIQNTTNGIYNN